MTREFRRDAERKTRGHVGSGVGGEPAPAKALGLVREEPKSFRCGPRKPGVFNFLNSVRAQPATGVAMQLKSSASLRGSIVALLRCPAVQGAHSCFVKRRGGTDLLEGSGRVDLGSLSRCEFE